MSSLNDVNGVNTTGSEDLNTLSQSMDKGTVEKESSKGEVTGELDITKGQQNGIKSDSPSEELIDSIEETLIISGNSVVQVQTSPDDTKVSITSMSKDGDIKSSNKSEDNDEKSKVPDDVGKHSVDLTEDNKTDTDVENETDIVITENKEELDTFKKLETSSESNRDSDSDSKVIYSTSSENIMMEKSTDNKDEMLGATGGPETSAQLQPNNDNSDDDDDDFRAMTEDEIQAVIRKYSFMDPEVRSRSLRFFWGLDVDRWGYFNVTHLRYWYRVQGSILTDDQIAKIFVDLDKDGDNLVSLDEFLCEMSKKRPRPYRPDELKEMFESWDVNKDGYICENDIRTKMESLGRTPQLYDIYTALHYDRTGRRRLGYSDFVRYAQEKMTERIPTTQQWPTRWRSSDEYYYY